MDLLDPNGEGGGDGILNGMLELVSVPLEIEREVDERPEILISGTGVCLNTGADDAG
jgi:hypothetical protein